jgi:arylsulfatase A-like enzyme
MRIRTLLLAPGALLLGSPTPPPPAPVSPPHLIVLVADDLRFDALGFTGNARARTPHLDALARQGVVFRRAFVTTSICAISRASILSGQYAWRHGIHDFTTPFTDSAFARTYPALLRRAGYHTGFIGKYGVGHLAHQLPQKAFDFWAGFAGHGVYWMKDEAGQPLHNTDWIGRQMQRFLQTRDRQKPFCLSVSFKAPHSEDSQREKGGFLPMPAFDSLYRHVRFPVPLTNQPRFYEAFPAAFRFGPDGRENEGRVRWRGRFDSTHFQTTTRAIYGLISGLDQVVGELVETLRREGLLRNTVIVFTSDNGFYQGEHGLSDKWYGHNESIRVPLLIVDGRRAATGARQTDGFALNIDLAPTLLTFAGLPLPGTMQGRPLQALLDHPDGRVPKGWRTDFFYEHRFEPGTYPVFIPHTEGIVTEQYKYMRYFRQAAAPVVLHEEVFAWQRDSLETRNLATERASARRVESLRRRMESLRAQNR